MRTSLSRTTCVTVNQKTTVKSASTIDSSTIHTGDCCPIRRPTQWLPLTHNTVNTITRAVAEIYTDIEKRPINGIHTSKRGPMLLNAKTFTNITRVGCMIQLFLTLSLRCAASGRIPSSLVSPIPPSFSTTLPSYASYPPTIDAP